MEIFRKCSGRYNVNIPVLSTRNLNRNLCAPTALSYFANLPFNFNPPWDQEILRENSQREIFLKNCITLSLLQILNLLSQCNGSTRATCQLNSNPLHQSVSAQSKQRRKLIKCTISDRSRVNQTDLDFQTTFWFCDKWFQRWAWRKEEWIPYCFIESIISTLLGHRVQRAICSIAKLVMHFLIPCFYPLSHGRILSNFIF